MLMETPELATLKRLAGAGGIGGGCLCRREEYTTEIGVLASPFERSAGLKLCARYNSTRRDRHMSYWANRRTTVNIVAGGEIEAGHCGIA